MQNCQPSETLRDGGDRRYSQKNTQFCVAPPLYMCSSLTLDSVMKVPLSLHWLLGHDLKQVVGVGDDLRGFKPDNMFNVSTGH